MKILFVLLVLGLVKTVLLYRGYHILPSYELKRRARAQDQNAAALYKVVAHEPELNLLLFISGLSCGSAAIVMATQATWWLGVITILVAVLLIFAEPKPKVGKLTWRYAVLTSKPMFKLVNWCYIFLHPLAGLLPKTSHNPSHAELYEKEDLLDLLSNQAKKLDSNLRDEDLKIAASALTFGDKKVDSIMTPRKKARFVSENESIGPVLMDELNATGFLRFPVTSDNSKAISPKVTGTLYINDLVDHTGSGRVRDVMSKRKFFINESCTLHQALDALIKNHHHILIVVNNFEEVVGMLMLEDVVEQVLGKRITNEFDKYEDLKAVAGLMSQKEPLKPHAQAAEPKPEPKSD